MIVSSESQSFDLGTEDFLKCALVWKNQFVKCDPNICSIIEKANFRANLMSDAIMETFDAGFHGKNSKNARVVNDIVGAKCILFGFLTFPFSLGNVVDLSNTIFDKFLKMKDVKKVNVPSVQGILSMMAKSSKI